MGSVEVAGTNHTYYAYILNPLIIIGVSWRDIGILVVVKEYASLQGPRTIVLQLNLQRRVGKL